MNKREYQKQHKQITQGLTKAQIKKIDQQSSEIIHNTKERTKDEFNIKHKGLHFITWFTFAIFVITLAVSLSDLIFEVEIPNKNIWELVSELSCLIWIVIFLIYNAKLKSYRREIQLILIKSLSDRERSKGNK